jgi:hypothetical protein
MTGNEPVEDAVDALYRAPLDRFVPARAELARSVGKEAAPAVRRLEKPNTLAWALNQLYWKERATFDHLVQATARVRAEQSAALLGQSHALREASAAHAAALSQARQAAARLLTQAGHPATPDALRALDAALEALPWKERPGRLVRPPAPQGFGALAGMAVADSPAQTPSPRAERTSDAGAERSGRTPASRAATAGRRAALDTARSAVDAARRALTTAEARATESEEALKRARQEENAARQAVERAGRTLKLAEQERRAAEEAQRGAGRARDAARAALARAEKQRDALTGE